MAAVLILSLLCIFCISWWIFTHVKAKKNIYSKPEKSYVSTRTIESSVSQRYVEPVLSGIDQGRNSSACYKEDSVETTYIDIMRKSSTKQDFFSDDDFNIAEMYLGHYAYVLYKCMAREIRA